MHRLNQVHIRTFPFFVFVLSWFSCSPFRHYPFCVSLLPPYVAARPSPFTPIVYIPAAMHLKLFSKISPVTVAARVCCWQEHLAFAPFSLSPSTQAAGSILVLYEPPYLALVTSKNLNLPLYLSFPLFACSRSYLPHSRFKSFLPSLRLPFARVRKYVSLSALPQYLVPAHVFVFTLTHLVRYLQYNGQRHQLIPSST